MTHGMTGLIEQVPGGVLGGLLVVSAILSYLLGCINGAVMISKYVLMDDIRDHGSGNAGLTNFYRTFGGKLTFAVIALDMMKTVIAVFLAWSLFHVILAQVPIFVRYWAGAWCALGHMFPCMFRFRGGKGILAGGTLALMLDWRIALVVWGVFIAVVLLTKLVSLGSCAAGVLFPVMSAIIYRDLSVFLVSLVIGALILWQHRGNIKRLMQGKESRFSFRRKKVRP